MKKCCKILVFLFCLFAFKLNAQEIVAVNIENELQQLGLGIQKIVLNFKIAPNWYILSNKPNKIGKATKISANYPIISQKWSKPLENEYNQTIFKNSITAEILLDIQEEKPLELLISWQACNGEECIPQSKNLTIQIFKDQNHASSGLCMFMLFAFLGGIILNVMPCVLPVLSIKAYTLINAPLKKRQTLKEAGLYAFGVVCSTLLFAILLWNIKSTGQNLGWGFQMQNSYFVFTMLLLFVFILLLITQKISISSKFLTFINKITPANAFFTGFLAILIASPCTAPFMGVAVAYALNSNLYENLAVFSSLGIGYSLPFALIMIFPKQIKKFLPKGKRFIENFKKICILLILATCIWLAWVLFNQINSSKPTKNSQWQNLDLARLETLLEKKEPVFINFSAKWCLTCMINEKTTLESEKFLDEVRKQNINLIKADWTTENKQVADLLAKYGRKSIPLYVYYKKGSTAYVVLPQILSPDLVLDYLSD